MTSFTQALFALISALYTRQLVSPNHQSINNPHRYVMGMEDGTGGENGSLEEFWATEDPIFSRKELLDIDLVPNEDRIIGRDSEIKNVASSIHPAVKGQSPRNTLIYGKTGTGKSLVAKHVTRSAQQYSVENGTELGRAYVDCTQTKTETRVVINLAQTLNDPEETGISIPVTGLSTDVYYERFWSILDHCYDVAIIILDEIDKLQDSEILMQLSRAGEAGKLDSCSVGIIAISNKISFKESLDERILSSLQDREFVFPPYDANQLREIMSNREDAFRDGVLSDDVIPLSAAFAAQEHGDARKALDILRNAGELAKDGDAEEVTEEHVRNARERPISTGFPSCSRGNRHKSRRPSTRCRCSRSNTAIGRSSRPARFTRRTRPSRRIALSGSKHSPSAE